MKNVKIEGVDELINNLSKTQEEMLKAGRRANLAGAKVVAKELEKNVPVSDRKGKKMRDNVAVSGNRTDRYTMRNYVAVGFPKGISHRVHFPNFGTINQSPQFYFETTIKNSQSGVQKAMLEEVRKVLK